MTKMFKKIGFTLIELLVVISIIGILLSVSVVTYTQVSKQSRDARRKTDLEQLRGALEQYRSASAANFYPKSGSGYNTDLNILTTPIIYVQTLPHDPKYEGGPNDYTYTALSATNGACDNVSTYCVTY